MKQRQTEIEAATYDIQEVAVKLGTGINPTYDLARRGALPVVRLGKRIKVLKEPFDRMLRGEIPFPEARQ